MQSDDPTYIPVAGCERQNNPDTALHPGLPLQCPRCRIGASGLECLVCGFQLQIQGGIVHALPPERSTHYQEFIRDYEHIRAAEGRGSHSEAYYLDLPYRDATQRNSRQWKIRARSYDYLATRVLDSLRENALILDLGAGNCWMSYRLALAGFQPIAVDLLTNEDDGLGAALHYHRHLSRPFPRFQAELASLPFQSGQFDAAIFNSSFHYAENGEAVLREALRCLKPEGMVIICDTPWYSSEDSGRQMVAERRAAFRARYGTESNSLESLEFVTDERLQFLEERLSIQWRVHEPWHGLRWALRPWVARLRNRREPSRFHIYVARKNA